MCTYALNYDRVSDGAEGIFDQALTNGLAAIVAHSWPGAELEGKRVLQASALLRVIEERGKAAGDTIRVLHDPDGPEWETVAFSDDPMPNFTEVDVAALNDALRTTQAIRHARADTEASTAVLTDAHIDALDKLDNHPALFAVTDEMIDRAEVTVAALDDQEHDRAARYYDLLGVDEQKRRALIDYKREFSWQTPEERCEVDICPVCGTASLVAQEFDSYLDTVGVGTCIACSYSRSRAQADSMAMDIQLRMAAERGD